MTSLYRCGQHAAVHRLNPPARQPGSGSLVVDMHCHAVIPAAETLAQAHVRAESEPMMRFASASTLDVNRRMRESIRERIVGVGSRLQEMDAQGVDVQAISPGPNHFCYWAEPGIGRDIARATNDGLAELVAQHPDRLVALGTVPLQAPELAIEEMSRCVRDLGMRGIEICTNVAGEELSADRFRPFLAAAEEMGVLLLMHPHGFSHGDRLRDYHLNNVIGNPLETTIALAQLIYGGVLDQYPGLKICAVHGGGMLPFYSGRFDHAWHARSDCSAQCSHPPSHYLRQIYFDTMVYDPDQLAYLIRKWGADRIVLGTDYPYDMEDKDPVGMVDQLQLTAEEREAILGGNAVQLLGLQEIQRRKKGND